MNKKIYSKIPEKDTRPYWTSILLRVCFTRKPIENCRFASDGPAVMSRRNIDDVIWAQIHFLTIVRSHTQST